MKFEVVTGNSSMQEGGDKEERMVVSIAEKLCDYGAMKEKLMLELIPVRGHEELLQKVPHRKLCDMAAVGRFMLSYDEHGEASILITRENMPVFGIAEEQLFEDAIALCPKNFPLVALRMEEVLFHLTGEDLPAGPGLWVVCNDIGRYGASVIMYPGVLEELAGKVGGGYYLIPSSVHEMILVPEGYAMNAAGIDPMVEAVNRTEVDPAERLTDHCYHYDPAAQLFETGEEYERRVTGEPDTAACTD